MPSIPSDLSLALTIFSALISGWLRKDGLSAVQNAIIAAVALIVEIGFTAWLISGFSGSLRDVTLEFIALAIALCSKELISLVGYVEAAPSPFVQTPTPTILTPRASRVTSSAYAPPPDNTNGAK